MSQESNISKKSPRRRNWKKIGLVVGGLYAVGLIATVLDHGSGEVSPTAVEAVAAASEASAAEKAEKEEFLRRRAVTGGLNDARAILADASLCDTPKRLAAAWKGLKQTIRTDAEWNDAEKAVSGLERCRQQAERALSKSLRELMVQQRADWPVAAERLFLDQGMDVRVVVAGAAKETVRLSWPLMGRVAIHRITNGDSMAEGSFLANVQALGFRKVVFSDGDETVTYQLQPEAETNAGVKVLAGVGLGEKLVLR